MLLEFHSCISYCADKHSVGQKVFILVPVDKQGVALAGEGHRLRVGKWHKLRQPSLG